MIVNPNAVEDKEKSKNGADPTVIVNPNAFKSKDHVNENANENARKFDISNYDDSPPSAEVEKSIRGLAVRDKVFEKLNNRQKKMASDILKDLDASTVPFAPMESGDQSVLVKFKETREKLDADHIKGLLNVE